MRYLVLLLLTSCVSLQATGPADWPRLQPVYHYASCERVTQECGINTHVIGCARPWFAYASCEIWLCSTADWVREHEEAHCLEGRDHPGESTMRDNWEQFKNRKD